MNVTLPLFTLVAIDHDCNDQTPTPKGRDDRVLQGRRPIGGVYRGAWLRLFVWSHIHAPIVYPSPEWCWANGEAYHTPGMFVPGGIMPSFQWASEASTCRDLLRARSAHDRTTDGRGRDVGRTQSEILRRLIHQHFGETPPGTPSVYPGSHAHDFYRCPTCCTEKQQPVTSDATGPRR